MHRGGPQGWFWHERDNRADLTVSVDWGGPEVGFRVVRAALTQLRRYLV
jgi:hypothetical protein